MKIYNTPTRSKEDFKPQKDNEVKMYVCGITPYDEPHLGHARCYVTFDIIRKYLIYKGYQVKYVQNYTDIDDKIIARAKELNEEPFQLANRFIESYHTQMKKLNIQTPDVEPRVTGHIPIIIDVVQGLLEKGFAYVADGDVYFSVEKFRPYGKLSGRALDEMKAGARVEPDEKKRNPLDFALWKKAKPGEPFWGSPWGKGRPGWHIECSSMSMKYLGETLDIHGGGQDLIFPHHENEIAQSEAYTNKRFVNYWLHNGFVTINKEKMSKSLGNFFTLKEIFEKYNPQVVRLFLIWQHYRTPLDFSDDKLEEAKKVMSNFLQFYRKTTFYIEKSKPHSEEDKRLIQKFLQETNELKNDFIRAMDDDFNTAQALGTLNKMVTHGNTFLQERLGKLSKEALDALRRFINDFNEFGKILGIDFSYNPPLPERLKKLIEEREEVRKKKDWQEADRIRKELLKEGIVLEDTTTSGTFWRWIKETVEGYMSENNKVIVVDDSKLTREIARDALEKENYEVIEIENGREALDLVFEKKPDIIILDIQMPEVDGWQVLKEVKEDFRTSSIPIIMLTIKGELETKTMEFKMGIVDYLTKPFDPLELVARVRTHLEHSEEKQGLNSLTGLPGNIALEEEIKKRLETTERRSAFMHLDIDRFKAFNDDYGYVQGDKAIKIVADAIAKALEQEGNPDDFVGHIGGDDFVIISTPDKADRICKYIIKQFDEEIRWLYKKDDIKKGYIVSEDILGRIQRFPIMTISIGVTTTERRGLNDYRIVADVAREVKKCAKRLSGSTYFKDRRKKLR